MRALRVHARLHKLVCLCINTLVCMRVCVYMGLYSNRHVCMCIYKHVSSQYTYSMHLHVSACTYTYICLCVGVYIHTDTHAHTQTCALTYQYTMFVVHTAYRSHPMAKDILDVIIGTQGRSRRMQTACHSLRECLLSPSWVLGHLNRVVSPTQALRLNVRERKREREQAQLT